MDISRSPASTKVFLSPNMPPRRLKRTDLYNISDEDLANSTTMKKIVGLPKYSGERLTIDDKVNIRGGKSLVTSTGGRPMYPKIEKFYRAGESISVKNFYPITPGRPIEEKDLTNPSKFKLGSMVDSLDVRSNDPVIMKGHFPRSDIAGEGASSYANVVNTLGGEIIPASSQTGPGRGLWKSISKKLYGKPAEYTASADIPINKGTVGKLYTEPRLRDEISLRSSDNLPAVRKTSTRTRIPYPDLQESDANPASKYKINDQNPLNLSTFERIQNTYSAEENARYAEEARRFREQNPGGSYMRREYNSKGGEPEVKYSYVPKAYMREYESKMAAEDFGSMTDRFDRDIEKGIYIYSSPYSIRFNTGSSDRPRFLRMFRPRQSDQSNQKASRWFRNIDDLSRANRAEVDHEKLMENYNNRVQALNPTEKEIDKLHGYKPPSFSLSNNLIIPGISGGLIGSHVNNEGRLVPSDQEEYDRNRFKQMTGGNKRLGPSLMR